MIQYLKGKGLTNEQIAGIIGNSATESGLVLDIENPSGAYKGLFQWEESRRPSSWDLQSQMDKMWEEYQTRTDSNGVTVAEHMANANSAEEAASIFRTYFEGTSSGASEREGYAKDALDYLNSNF